MYLERSISIIKRVHPATLAALCTFVIFSFPLILDLRYFGLDASLVDIPFLCELKSLASSGKHFLLSPRIGNGEPLLANINSQALYPIRWAGFFFTPIFQKSLEVIFHLSLAAFAMSYLLTRFGIRKVLCLVGGISYALSGTVLDLINHGPYLIIAGWIPLAWASIKNILENRQWNRFDFLILLFSLLCLLTGGDPQSFVILAGIALIEIFLAKSRSFERSILLFLPFLLSLGLTAPLLFAMVAEMKLSARLSNLDLKNILQWSMDLPTALATMWPGILLEHTQQGVNFWSAWLPEDAKSFGMPWNRNPYLSLPIMASAIIYVREKKTRAVFVTGLMALFLSLGSHLWGIESLIQSFPILGTFRYPMKYFLLATVAIWVLAFLGFDSAMKESAVTGKRKSLIKSLLFFVFLQIIALITILDSKDILDTMAFKNGIGVAADLSLPLLSDMLLKQIFHSLGIALLSLLCLSLPYYRGYRIVNLIPWIIILDLSLAGFSGISLDNNFLGKASPLKSVLDSSAKLCHDYRLADHNLRFTVETSHGQTTVYSPSILWKLVDMPNLSACDGISSSIRYSVLEQYPAKILNSKVREGNLSASTALGCTHLLTTSTPTGSSGFKTKLIPVPGLSDLIAQEENMSPRLYEIINPVPSVFISEKPVLHANTDSELEKIVVSRDTAEILNQMDDPLRKLGTEMILPSNTKAKIKAIRWDERDRVEVDLVGEGAAVIGLNSAFAAGWSASQSGKILPVFRVAGNLIGTLVPDAANGRVIFTYSLYHFHLGLWLSLCSVLLLLVFLWRFPKQNL